MTPIDVFIDEYGGAQLATEMEGATTYFIVTAVIVRERLAEVRQRAEEIRRAFVQTGEMKSSSIGGNETRRVSILQRISKLPIRTYTVAVDKREIRKSSGLAYKATFFKFVNRKLYTRIYDAYDHVRVVADEHGAEAFMQGFERYIEEHVGLHRDLFLERSFRFSRSDDEILLQVADFLSGCLARTIDPKKKSTNSAALLDLLQSLSIGVEHWPPRNLPFPALSAETSRGPFDSVIRNHCVRQAILFLDRTEADCAIDEKLRAQHETLKLLLFRVQFGAENEFVLTREIIRHLRSNCGIGLSAQQIRSLVVSQLRDANVVVASGPRGYKLPVSEADIREFVMHAQSIIPPMLSRLGRAREGLLMVSHKEFDLLGSPEHEELRTLVDRQTTVKNDGSE
jgi:hypothetical protein